MAFILRARSAAAAVQVDAPPNRFLTLRLADSKSYLPTYWAKHLSQNVIAPAEQARMGGSDSASHLLPPLWASRRMTRGAVAAAEEEGEAVDATHLA
jgi:hypothetical protein